MLACLLATQKAEKKDGVYVTRSILGDPAAFDELERRGRVASPVRGQSKRKARPVVKKVEEVATADSISLASTQGKIFRDVGLYVSAIQQQYVRSEGVRVRDEKRLTTLMAYLPINDKFNMNKEGQTLTRWQERQKDWLTIQEGISKRIEASKTHSLMMSKTFDFRIKREEYDLIQAAIPPDVKFGSSVWERSLRNGNTRIVSVGHVFTGAYTASACCNAYLSVRFC
jgi:predicted Zn-dependent protease